MQITLNGRDASLVELAELASHQVPRWTCPRCGHENRGKDLICWDGPVACREPRPEVITKRTRWWIQRADGRWYLYEVTT